MSLCLECGLCCDGSMFEHAMVTEDAAARLLGRVRLTPERDRLLQPCQALRSDKCCAVYEERPGACRVYRCLALAQLEKGEATLEESREAVEELKARRARVAEALGMPQDPVAAVFEARSRQEAGTLDGPLAGAWERYQRLVILFQLPGVSIDKLQP